MSLKLFMVLYVFGDVAATVGPLPYGMSECQERLPFLGTFEKLWADGGEFKHDDGRVAKRRDVRQACEWRLTRPAIKGPSTTLGSTP